MDREGSDIDEVIKDIKGSLTKDVIDISESLNIKEGKLDEELIEFIAERDDELFEKYLSDEYDL